MLKRVNDIYIGGVGVDRTVTIGDTVDVYSSTIATGEILVTDSNLTYLDPATISFNNAQKIHIVEALDEQRDLDGNAITRLLVSQPIDGRLVVSYQKDQYEAKVEQAVTYEDVAAVLTVGTEYVLRLVFKDMVEYPGQYVETYRYIAKDGDSATEMYNSFVSQINKTSSQLGIKSGSRVKASFDGAIFTLTGKPIPECTSSVKDIDEFSMVQFQSFLNYVDKDGHWETFLTATSDDEGPTYGNGNWEQIRDVEKFAQSYKGIMNRTWFPIILPAMRTVKGQGYVQIVIEYDISYRSADNQYKKKTPLTTVIALPTGSGQITEIQTALDNWMGSLPAPLTDGTNLS